MDILNPRIEASHYVNDLDFLAKIPYLGRDSTEVFIDFLYKMGAQSVEISKVSHAVSFSNFIREMYVRITDQEKVRDLLNLMFKAHPFAIEETTARVFRLEWRDAHSYPLVLKHGSPKISM